jgi:hypothetical protein
MINVGSINVAYHVRVVSQLNKKQSREEVDRSYLEISNKDGIVTPGKFQTFTLTYTPRSLKDKLISLQVVIEVEFGPRFILPLNGDLSKVNIDFSFDEYDFGPVLVARDSADVGMTVPLVITNRTLRKVNLDLVDHVLPSSMTLGFTPLILEPGSRTIHTVMFLPTEVGCCLGTLTFLMNGSTTKSVALKGEGVAVHVEVPARMRHLAFNNSIVGKRSVHTLEVFNRARVEITGRVVLQNRVGSAQLKILLDNKILYVTHGKYLETNLSTLLLTHVP